jgi:hypothetical protein
VFPGSGCPVPESPASGTGSAVSKRVHEGAEASRAIAIVQGKFRELRLSTHRSGHWWLLQYAITLKVTSPRALGPLDRVT